MASINVDLDYFDHPKTKRLVGLLGRGSDVLPLRLWCYCGKYHAEKGGLTGMSAQEIESMVGWWGTAGKMIEAMLQVGFVDECDGAFIVHDWVEYQGHIHAGKVKAKKAAQARWSKLKGVDDAPSNAPSIATSIALSNAPSNALAMQGKAMQGRANGPPQENDHGRGEPTALQKAAAALAQEFCHGQHPRHNGDSVYDIGNAIESMLDAGYTLDMVSREIHAKRDRSERWWQLKRRLEKELEAKSRNGPPEEDPEERARRNAEYWRREREEEERKPIVSIADAIAKRKAARTG